MRIENISVKPMMIAGVDLLPGDVAEVEDADAVETMKRLGYVKVVAEAEEPPKDPPAGAAEAADDEKQDPPAGTSENPYDVEPVPATKKTAKGNKV